MGKGTPASGKHNKEGHHIRCRRCGKHSFHVKKGSCASCGYGATAKLRQYNWHVKTRGSYGHKARNIRKQSTERKRTGNQHTKGYLIRARWA